MAELPRPDRTLGTLMSIRSQRVQRAEADCVRARRTCEDAKAAVHAAIAEVRAASEQATRFWRDTMTAFKQMWISSAELLRAKADYQRRRDHTDERRAAARQAVHRLRQARQDRRTTQQNLRLAQRACEKLSLWRDELLALQPKE